MRRASKIACLAVLAGGMLLGCGESTGLLNPTFINTAIGGIFELVPYARNGFVLALVTNSTSGSPLPQNIKFMVTAERQVQTVGPDGVVTVATESETAGLLTFPVQPQSVMEQMRT